MREVLKHIVLWSMLLTFLVSASGFRMVKHTCPSCNLVEYTLHNPASCCETEAPVEAQEPVSCCTPAGAPMACTSAFTMDSCCEYESQLFVIEELVAPTTFKVEAALVNLPLQIARLDLPEDVSVDLFFAAYQHPPPPVFSGLDYLVYLHQLKIAFC